MTEFHTPTEQELDELLTSRPEFDLDAVKRRTLSRVESIPARTAKRRTPLRTLLIAAITCLLSVSVVAAADYTAGGRLSQALGIRKASMETITEPVLPEEPVAAPPETPPLPLPPPAPEEPPELDEQIAGALQIAPEVTPQLRPAVQQVQQTAEDQDVRMTVLQTLGDPACLYVKLRFDFPEEVPYTDQLQFKTFDIAFDSAARYSWSEEILERTATSITYLLSIKLLNLESLTGKTAAITVEDYGVPHRYTEDEVVHLFGEAGKPYTTIILPDGSMHDGATGEDVAALPPAADDTIWSEGFTVSRRTDGSTLVTYDGVRSAGPLDVYLVPDFDPVIAGTWEQSWTLSYQDLSRSWSGAADAFDPALTMTSFHISPLSWKAAFTAVENVPEGETLSFELIPKDWNAQLRRRDGSLTDLPLRWSGGSSSASAHDEEGFLVTDMTVGDTFEQPIDISDVAAVLIDGKEFPIS